MVSSVRTAAFAILALATTGQVVKGKTIYDVAMSSPIHTTYAAAANKTRLASILQGQGPLTVFAPTDDAFGALENSKLLQDDEWVLHLENILLHHTVAAQFTILNLRVGFTSTALSGEDLTVTSVAPPKVNDAQLVAYDLGSSNGVFLATSSVILPTSATKDILEIAAGTDSLQTFVNTLSTIGFGDNLQSEGPHTVFAPTDEAFSAAAADLASYDNSALTDILKYHVVPGIIFASDLVEGAEFVTLEGTSLTVSAIGSVSESNILAKNGIIHAIDRVLMPPEPLVVDPTLVPTASPTLSPTSSPTESPTDGPTVSPTNSPTNSPTETPTASPTGSPTDSPTSSPTSSPTASPTGAPTGSPTASPTTSPTDSPTVSATEAPTGSPTASPTSSPTVSPIGSLESSSNSSVTDANTTATLPVGSLESSSNSSVTDANTTATSPIGSFGSPSNSSVADANTTAAPPTLSPTEVSNFTTLADANSTGSPTASPTAPPMGNTTGSPTASPTSSPVGSSVSSLNSSATDDAIIIISTPTLPPTIANVSNITAPVLPQQPDATADSCAISLSVDCVTDEGDDCDLILLPDDSCANGDALEALRFRYLGGECTQTSNDQQELSSCVDGPNGGPNWTGLTVITCQDESGTNIFKGPVSIGDTIVLTKNGGSLGESATCRVADTSATTLQTIIFDTSGDVDLSLKDTFGSLELESCTTVSGLTNDCFVGLNYTYGVANVGGGDLILTEAMRYRNSIAGDLFPQVNDTSIGPNEDITFLETETLDACDSSSTFRTIFSVQAMGSGGTNCSEAIIV